MPQKWNPKMCTLGVSVTSNEPETNGNNLPAGRKLYPEYERAKAEAERAWRMVEKWDGQGSIIHLIDLATEADNHVREVYDETPGLGKPDYENTEERIYGK